VAEHRVLDAGVHLVQRAVDTVEQERAQRRVRRHVGGDQADRRKHDHAEDEPRAKGHQPSPSSSM
jgi:hypothetical protein